MRHHGLSGTLGLTISGCSWILFSIGYFLYDISTVLENAQGVNRSSNSKDSRHDPLLYCWLGRGSIRMTADMTDHFTVGLGGAQFEWQQTWPITPLLAWEGLNSNDSRHDPLLHCWLGRGSIRMTADMADHSAVGLGGAQFELQQTWPITPLMAWEGLFNTNCDHVNVLNIRVKCWPSHVTGWAELL